MEPTPAIPFIAPGKEMTLSAVAQLLGCSDRNVERLIQKGFFSKGHKAASGIVWWEGDIAVYRFRLFRGDFQDDPTEGD